MHRRRSNTKRHCNTILLASIFLSAFYLLFFRNNDDTSTSPVIQEDTRPSKSDLEAEQVIQWLADHGHKPQLPPVKDSRGKWMGTPQRDYQDPLHKEFFSWRPDDYILPQKPPAKGPKERGDPIPDPFPLLSSVGNSSREMAKLQDLLKPIPMNRPPNPHVPESTPLLIGFTRNWPQLIQCVSSYISAGWPPSDIHIVENTGTMHANRDNRLTLQNPFYLNHTQLHILGVNIITTPTLLTFAQLQNFYAWTALDRGWEEFFWSHEDILVFSHEDEPVGDDSHLGIDSTNPQTLTNADGSPVTSYSLYTRCLAILRYLRSPRNRNTKWANYFFAYDHLTLVNTAAMIDVGGWDTHIPFYATDCDMYNRLMWNGYYQGEGSSASVGLIFDVSTTLNDVAALFRVPGVKAEFVGDVWEENDHGSEEFHFYGRSDDDTPPSREDLAMAKEKHTASLASTGESFPYLLELASRMVSIKYLESGISRNAWQLRQSGGQGEPFYRDADGFQWGLQMAIDGGRAVYAEKWGHRGCDVAWMGVTGQDEWRLERDWDESVDGWGAEGPSW